MQTDITSSFFREAAPPFDIPLLSDFLPPGTLRLQARSHLMQGAAAKLDPIAAEALAILEKKLMEDVSNDAAEVRRAYGHTTPPLPPRVIVFFLFLCEVGPEERRAPRRHSSALSQSEKKIRKERHQEKR